MTQPFSLVALAAMFLMVLQGCGPSFYGQVQPKVETWEVTTSAPSSTVAENYPQPASPSPASVPADGWTGIYVGQTTRQEIEVRVGQGKSSKGRLLYQVDTIPALITYGEDNIVRLIRVTPSVAMNEAALLAAYGKADRERRSDDFLRIWEYDRTGMMIEFASDNTTAAAIEYHVPTVLATKTSER